MLTGTINRRAVNWRSVAPPVALCAFVALLGALPYLLLWHDSGSLAFFTSAYDESNYLLSDTFVAYRLLSDAILGALELFTPGSASLMVVSDILLPMAVALAAWALVTRCLSSTPLRVFAVLGLLFGQEILSLANSIVWTSAPLMDVRTSHPTKSLELIPDATTSYFSLFRTPEPQVSWVVLFGFLALIAGPDPLRAFEGRRRWLTLPIFVSAPFIYPFISLPILALGGLLLLHALAAERPRARGVVVALAIAVIAWIGSAAVGGRDATSSVLFDSRLPIVTPAIVIGVLIAIAMVVRYRLEVLRRAELLVAFAAALFPVVISNQQLITGVMVSTRDWERNTNYVLILFAVIALIGMRERSSDGPRPLVRALAWSGSAIAAVLLVHWQREVYDVWSPTNTESQSAAALIESLPADASGLPIVMENAGLVPEVRVITGDDHDFVLDYSRLFEDPIPSFADGWEGSDEQAASQERIFEYWFSLGRSPQEVRAQLIGELADPTVAGFYSHFLFSLHDVWPPLTDWRGLRRDVALEKLPGILADYRAYSRERLDDPGSPIVLVTNSAPVPDAHRSFDLLGSDADGSTGVGPQVYLESFR